MGLSIGKDADAPGKFSYELWIGFETVARVGGFGTKAEAEQAGHFAQRAALFPPVASDEPEMSDDDILAALDALDVT